MSRNPFLSRAGFDADALSETEKEAWVSRNPFLSRAGFDADALSETEKEAWVSRNPFLSRAGFDELLWDTTRGFLENLSQSLFK